MDCVIILIELEWLPFLSKRSGKEPILDIPCNFSWAWKRPNSTAMTSSLRVNLGRMAALLPNSTQGGDNSVADWGVSTQKNHIESVINNTTKARKVRLEEKMWTWAKDQTSLPPPLCFVYWNEIRSYFKLLYNTVVSIKCSLVKNLFFHLWLH